MNLGVCIVHGSKPIDEAFRDVAAMGFSHCQLNSWDRRLWTTQEADSIRSAMEALRSHYYRLLVRLVRPGLLGFLRGPGNAWAGAGHLSVCPNEGFDGRCGFRRAAGIVDVATHVGFLPENPHDPNYAGVVAALKQVAAHLQENGQYLLFETGQETPVTLLRTFEDVGAGNLGVNLDPANLVMYGKANPVDALEIIGKYVRGVHAKDGRYPDNGRYLGAGSAYRHREGGFPSAASRPARLRIRRQHHDRTGNLRAPAGNGYSSCETVSRVYFGRREG